MKKWKILSFALTVLMAGSLLLAGCKKQSEVKTFTGFVATTGTSLAKDNRLQNVIAGKVGAKADISFLSGQTDKEYVQSLIQKGEYPDFIDGMEATSLLLEANALIPLDDYIDNYPNLKNLYTEAEWNQLRQSDGHIYYMPQFSKENIKSTRVDHPDEAFWIQKRVLKWAGYPKLKTVRQYFDVIERYIEAHPDEEAIGFEILCDDWRYFCLENVPQFLAGYPNDGCCVVNRDTKEVSVYDTLPEAKEYYKILSEEYDKGMIKNNTFVQTYQEYLTDLSTGKVLGMVDQHWQFQQIETILRENDMEDCTYVPFGLTLDENVKGEYCSRLGFNTSTGMGITISCKDVEGALQFMNDILDPEIVTLCNWGEVDIDYQIGEDGVFYRTEEQRKQAKNPSWSRENLCSYSYFPHYGGMMMDGINAVLPDEQPKEYYDNLNDLDREIMDAYGYEKWTDFSNCAKENSDWFPLYTATNTWTSDTDYGVARENMTKLKHKWLPKLILAPVEKYDSLWESYMKLYEMEVDVEAYEKELEAEIARRIEAKSGN